MKDSLMWFRQPYSSRPNQHPHKLYRSINHSSSLGRLASLPHSFRLVSSDATYPNTISCLGVIICLALLSKRGLRWWQQLVSRQTCGTYGATQLRVQPHGNHTPSRATHSRSTSICNARRMLAARPWWSSWPFRKSSNCTLVWAGRLLKWSSMNCCRFGTLKWGRLLGARSWLRVVICCLRGQRIYSHSWEPQSRKRKSSQTQKTET